MPTKEDQMVRKGHTIEKQPVALYIRKFYRQRYNFWAGTRGRDGQTALENAEQDVRQAVGIVLDHALIKAREEIKAESPHPEEFVA